MFCFSLSLFCYICLLLFCFFAAVVWSTEKHFQFSRFFAFCIVFMLWLACALKEKDNKPLTIVVVQCGVRNQKFSLLSHLFVLFLGMNLPSYFLLFLFFFSLIIFLFLPTPSIDLCMNVRCVYAAI
jgi:hypothetical protein